MPQYMKNKNNTWAIRFNVKDETTGEYKKIYLSGFKLKEDATNAWHEYVDKNNKGFVLDKVISVREYLEYWFDNYVVNSVAPRTIKEYAEIIRNHIIPALGNIQLNKLKPLQIQKFYTDRLNAKSKKWKKVDGELQLVDTENNISAQYVLHIHRVLHLALKWAVTWQYISINPASSVKPPKLKKNDLHIPTDDHIAKMLRYLKDTPLYMPVYIAITTGMRLGEICGLQADDVDIGGNTYNVKYSYQKIQGEMRLTNTKTHRSKRPIQMLEGTIPILQEYIKQKFQYKYQLGDAYKDSNFFCTWEDGSPLLPQFVSKKFKKLVRSMELDESITFHSLRHYHATWLLRQGVNPKIVAERLGHTSVNITLNRYTHLLMDTQKDVIGSLKGDLFLDKK